MKSFKIECQPYLKGGGGRQLDPDFDMTAEASPFMRRAMLARYAPVVLAKRGWQGITTVIDLITSGSFRVQVDLDDLERFADRIDQSLSRLAMSGIVAALIVGSSIVMTVQGGPTMLGLPFFGLLGFAGAVIGAIGLLFSIWRSGK